LPQFFAFRVKDYPPLILDGHFYGEYKDIEQDIQGIKGINQGKISAIESMAFQSQLEYIKTPEPIKYDSAENEKDL
jgi:hypothetical protein